MKTVDLVVPCYNEGGMVELFYNTTSDIVSKIDGYEFRFIFIDDGSRDNTLDEIKKLNPWAFTIGSAFFDKKFGDDFAEQIDKVCEYIEK